MYEDIARPTLFCRIAKRSITISEYLSCRQSSFSVGFGSTTDHFGLSITFLKFEFSGKSYDIPEKEEAINKQRKSLLEKRGPQITISLTSSAKNKDGETAEGFDEQGLFKQRTYLVCAQSPSCDSRWRTTRVNFPDEAWKLERRRLSHRHSSLGSSISLSFARLDLACKTPEHSPMSTPICDKNFVFPNINGF